jgi:hypothetical protein
MPQQTGFTERKKEWVCGVCQGVVRSDTKPATCPFHVEGVCSECKKPATMKGTTFPDGYVCNECLAKRPRGFDTEQFMRDPATYIPKPVGKLDLPQPSEQPPRHARAATPLTPEMDNLLHGDKKGGGKGKKP